MASGLHERHLTPTYWSTVVATEHCMSGDSHAKIPELLCTMAPPYCTVCMYNILNTKYVEMKHFDNIFFSFRIQNTVVRYVNKVVLRHIYILFDTESRSFPRIGMTCLIIAYNTTFVKVLVLPLGNHTDRQ